MKAKSTTRGKFLLDISRSELILLNNALNEVCNGVHISDSEFSTRLGASHNEARRLLQDIGDALEGTGSAPA